MNRDSLWLIAAEKALLDREEFLQAWEGCESAVVEQTKKEIASVSALRKLSFGDALASDREGVRVTLLSAENWYQSLACAQTGKESRSALSLYKKVNSVRLKLFGRTKLEAAISEMVPVPIHKVIDMLKTDPTRDGAKAL